MVLYVPKLIKRHVNRTIVKAKPTPWTITREWEGQTAFIIAGGPSVREEDLSVLAGRRVVVVNSSYLTYPDADILFFGDARWWNHHNRNHRAELLSFDGRKVTCSAAVRGEGVIGLKRVVPPPGFAEDPSSVASQRTSLQGAMNMVAHMGVARIVIIGADMGRAPDGSSHHHVAHPWPNAHGNITWDQQMEQLRMIEFPLTQRGINVINTSLNSRITWWPKMPLAQAAKLGS